MLNITTGTTIHQIVEHQVALTPDEIAVVFQDQQLTYKELNQQANQLAHYLKTLGVGPEVLVGICVERSIEMIVALLAILKAGGAYVPLDPAYPQKRLAHMVEDSQATVLLTQQQLIGLFPSYSSNVVCLDQEWGTDEQTHNDNLNSETQPDNLAYVIYTSGSTGRPKGVAMPHLPLVNLLTWQLENFKKTQARTLQFTPISFDVSFQEIFSTLCSGGTLILIADADRRDIEALLRYLSNQSIERLFLPFVALQHLAEVAMTQPTLPLILQEVITAGEQLKITRSVAHWFDQLQACTLYNQYGPSETHVVTAYTLSGPSHTWPLLPPIGQAIANTRIYLLNPKTRRKDDPIELAAVGEAGELAISGIALARGYLNQPELTDNKFLADPFSNEPEARLYRTGDLVRYGVDGNLEFVERIDEQVKIRGVRIELGEIEVNLSQHPVVKNSVVIVREDEVGSKHLVAYIVADSNQFTKNERELSQQLRSFLKEKLPACMLPSAFVFLDALPLTPSGKVDRRSLPTVDLSTSVPSESLVSPRTPIEKQLTELWSQVLRTGPIGIYDSFFDFGGDSLRAIQLIVKVRETFQIDLPIVALFDAPAVAQFVEFVLAAINSKNSDTSDAISVAELRNEAVLDLAIQPGAFSSKQVEEPENIFITGVTGFLGAFLLQELLEQTQASIHCLVRAADFREGQEKIANNLKKYLLWHESYRSRIIPVIGDLAQPLLGVTELQFAELTDKIDVIYHNGASINLIYPYSALRTANVVGTEELLKLATQTRTKPVHFISTLDVFQTSRAFSADPIMEDDELNPAEAIHFDGYTKSKWVSEQMIRTAQSRGLPATIYRPAMITGHSKTGAGNTNDLMNRLIKGFIQLGSAPDFEMMFNIAPADYFSKGVVYISRQPDSLGKAFNCINPKPVPMHQFVEVINKSGYSVRQVEHKIWEDLLISNVTTLDGVVAVLTSKISKKSVSYIERSSVGANLVSCANVLNALEGTSIVCPPIDTQMMSTYFSYFAQIGFLDAPAGENKTLQAREVVAV
jgi:amino acid adenylation domain-containing protein/thioester reductase-like protein